jgi:hypothetical protein
MMLPPVSVAAGVSAAGLQAVMMIVLANRAAAKNGRVMLKSPRVMDCGVRNLGATRQKRRVDPLVAARWGRPLSQTWE